MTPSKIEKILIKKLYKKNELLPVWNISQDNKARMLNNAIKKRMIEVKKIWTTPGFWRALYALCFSWKNTSLSDPKSVSHLSFNQEEGLLVSGSVWEEEMEE